jgi:hypothetical protein
VDRVAKSISTRTWTLEMPAGSLQQWTFTFTVPAPGGTAPWPFTRASWEYVARVSATDTGAPLIQLTDALGTFGVIVVTSTATLSQLLLEIYPGATEPLAPGTYYHALWMNPGSTSALCVFDGLLIIDGAPQP